MATHDDFLKFTGISLLEVTFCRLLEVNGLLGENGLKSFCSIVLTTTNIVYRNLKINTGFWTINTANFHWLCLAYAVVEM